MRMSQHKQVEIRKCNLAPFSEMYFSHTFRKRLRTRPPGTDNACRVCSTRLLRKYAFFAYAAFFILIFFSSCATDRVTSADTITVEGMVTVRGNEPFEAYILETPDRNTYVLAFSNTEEIPTPETPARLRVTGRLYLVEWEGQSCAHIEVHAYEEPLK